MFSNDFIDVIPAPVSSMQTATATIAGYTGAATVTVAGMDAQISVDGVAWSTSLILFDGGAIRVRMTASASANETKTAVVSIQGISADFAVSTANPIRTYTSSGTFPRPTIGRNVKAECWGAGGGGGGAGGAGSIGGGGGGGGYSVRTIARGSLAAIETVTVGLGGAGVGASSNSNGAIGGASAFGSHLTASGGGLGSAASLGGAAGAGGIGITATGGAGSGTTGGAGASGGGAGAALGGTGGFPGGGGGGTTGGGGGGSVGNGGGASGPGGNGRCIVTIIP